MPAGWPEELWFDSWQLQEISLFSTAPHSFWDTFSPVFKLDPGYKTDQSPLLTADVKNESNFASTAPYATTDTHDIVTFAFLPAIRWESIHEE
jgi:hypothetical protein